MSARKRFPHALEKTPRRPAPRWVMPAIVVIAVLVVAGALVVTIATGTLFTTPGR